MTPDRIDAIAAKHLSRWMDSDPSMPGAPTCRNAVADAIAEALAVETALYRDGATALRAERDRTEGALAAVKAAASFDPAQDRDLETCVRRLYHEARAKSTTSP